MILGSLNRDDLHSILMQLDQALYNHTEWHKALNRTLTCRLPSNKHDLQPTAHKECLFGKWYYNGAPSGLKDHPGFVTLGIVHQLMHQQAIQLLRAGEGGGLVEPQDYDDLADTLDRMQLELSSLKHEVEMTLYTRDPLTGAINRADMLPILREIHEMAKRGSVCSIAMMDIDHFRKTNDKLGHALGDKVLMTIAQYLTANLRPYDKIFRYGGEEFLLCMQQAELSSCYERAERLREGISLLPFENEIKDKLSVTVSFGVTLLDPSITVEESIQNADKALLEAKAAGRNKVKVWKP